MLGSGAASQSLRQGKGIYKPAGSDYALWIRSTLEGQRRYADQIPQVLGPGGTWEWQYNAEDSAGQVDPGFWTNKSLLACFRDQKPIGVFRQVIDDQGNKAYEVLGSAFVVGWDGRHFTLRGASPQLTPVESEVDVPFHPYSNHGHTFSPGMIARRPLQAWFKSRVLWAYNERCALCGYGVRSAGRPRGLEAAHVVPHSRRGTSEDIRNGIALCANHHSLFDEPAWAWTLDEELRVVVGDDPELRRTIDTNCLPRLEGKVPPFLPNKTSLRPAREAVEIRMRAFQAHQ